MSPTTHDGVQLDKEGLNEERPESISTWHGRIEPLHPSQDDVDVQDIAHALSRLCRYNGHVGGFLSVARHSLWVSERVYTQTNSNAELALSGLLHDGAEAYLSDVPRPVKRAPEMAVFRELDAKMDQTVMEHFGLPFPIPEVVMEADRYVLLEVELPNPEGARYHWNSTPAEDQRDWLARYYWLTDQIEKVGSERRLPTLIGITGFARSGKDSVAGFLRPKYERIAFADKLKAIALTIDPLVQVSCEAPRLADISVCCDIQRVSWLLGHGADEGWLKEHTNYRVFLQDLGNAVRETLGKSTWIDAALRDRDTAKRYVITDVRYANEADAVRAAGGEIWRIERPDTGPANDHVSELEMVTYPVDHVIVNDLDTPALRFKTARTLEVS